MIQSDNYIERANALRREIQNQEAKRRKMDEGIANRRKALDRLQAAADAKKACVRGFAA